VIPYGKFNPDTLARLTAERIRMFVATAVKSLRDPNQPIELGARPKRFAHLEAGD
jgi:hypothetical protein